MLLTIDQVTDGLFGFVPVNSGPQAVKAVKEGLKVSMYAMIYHTVSRYILIQQRLHRTYRSDLYPAGSSSQPGRHLLTIRPRLLSESGSIGGHCIFLEMPGRC